VEKAQQDSDNERLPKRLRKMMLPSANRISRLEFHQLNLVVVLEETPPPGDDLQASYEE
jgi:hypothetical protein